MTTRQYARLLSDWIGCIGLDPCLFGTHSLRRTKATLIYRRTGNLPAVQPFHRATGGPLIYTGGADPLRPTDLGSHPPKKKLRPAFHETPFNSGVYPQSARRGWRCPASTSYF